MADETTATTENQETKKVTITADQLKKQGFKSAQGVTGSLNKRRIREHNSKLAAQYYPDVQFSAGSEAYDLVINGLWRARTGGIEWYDTENKDNYFGRGRDPQVKVTTENVDISKNAVEVSEGLAKKISNMGGGTVRIKSGQYVTSPSLVRNYTGIIKKDTNNKITVPYGLELTPTSMAVSDPNYIFKEKKKSIGTYQPTKSTPYMGLAEQNRKANFPLQETVDKYSKVPTFGKPYGLVTSEKLPESKLDRFSYKLNKKIDFYSQKAESLRGKDTIKNLQYSGVSAFYGGVRGVYNLGRMAINPIETVENTASMIKNYKDTASYFAYQLKNQPAAFIGEIGATYGITKGLSSAVKYSSKLRVNKILKESKLITNELEAVEKSKPNVVLNLETQTKGGGLLTREGQTIGTSTSLSKGLLEIEVNKKTSKFKIRSDTQSELGMNTYLNMPESSSISKTKIGSSLTKPDYVLKSESKFLIEDNSLFSKNSITGYGRELSVLKNTETKTIKALAGETQFKASVSMPYTENVPLVERSGFAELGSTKFKTPYLVLDPENTFVKQTYGFRSESSSRLVASKMTDLKKIPNKLYTKNIGSPDYFKYIDEFKGDVNVRTSGGIVQRTFEGFDYSKKFNVNGYDVEVKLDIPKSPDTVNFDNLMISRGFSEEPYFKVAKSSKKRKFNVEPKLASEVYDKKIVKEFFDDTGKGQKTVFEDVKIKAGTKERLVGDPATSIKRAGLEIGEDIKTKTANKLRTSFDELNLKAQKVGTFGDLSSSAIKTLNFLKPKQSNYSIQESMFKQDQRQKPTTSIKNLQEVGQDQDQRQRQLQKQGLKQISESLLDTKQVTVPKITPSIPSFTYGKITPKTTTRGKPLLNQLDKSNFSFKNNRKSNFKSVTKSSPDLFSITNKLKGNRKLGTVTGFTARLI